MRCQMRLVTPPRRTPPRRTLGAVVALMGLAVTTAVTTAITTAITTASATPVAAADITAAAPSPAVIRPATLTEVGAAYEPLDIPRRIVDSRTTGAFGAGAAHRIRTVGAEGLPGAAGAVAAVVNITVVGPAGVGFWTAYPAGQAVPTASHLNVDERSASLGAGLALANLVTVPIGADGAIELFSQSGGHVLVDLLGVYREVGGPVAAGRLAPLDAPARILDTRTFLPLGPAEVLTWQVPGAAGADAAVLTVTTIATAPGFWQVYPVMDTRPDTTTLNSLATGQVVPNQVIVPLDADGRFRVFSQSGGHLVIDVVALVTGASAAPSTDGLFVPLDRPTRFLDTRDPALHPLRAAQMALPRWNLEVGVGAHPAIGRSDVAAIAVNLTSTEVLAPGYVSLTPAGSNDPAVPARTTSTSNLTRAGQTLPGHATVAVSGRGVDVFTQSGAHLLVDVAGYYRGTPVPAPFGPPQLVDPTPAGCLGHPTRAVAALASGASAASVRVAQQRLLDLGFWLAGVDGVNGHTTRQAVMAFQKYHGIRATGQLDDTTAAALNQAGCRPTGASTTGDVFEVDKTRQLGFVVRGGRTLWVVNVSTGSEIPYREWSDKTQRWETGDSITPAGRFRVYFERPTGWWEGELGGLYRPKYFRGGIAVHGSGSIPAHPASHGCVRVSTAAMDFIWAANLLPMRSEVWVYGAIPGR